MKRWRLIVGLLLSWVLLGSAACNSFGGEEEDPDRLAEVARGDLTITVSGSGNIEVSQDLELTSGVGGRIEEILVEEGTLVSEGEVLVRLETDTLQLALTQAEVTNTQAEVTVVEAEVALAQAEVALAQAGVVVTQAEINLKNAEIGLEQTIITSTLSDIKVAQAEVDVVRRDLDAALSTLSAYDTGTPGYGENQKRVILAEARLNTAEDALDAMLLGTDTKDVAVKKQQVEIAEQSLEVARQALESTGRALVLARLAPEVAGQAKEFAGQSLEQARRQLDKATIIALFDGAVARIHVDVGDTVLASTPIVYLIVPVRMELKLDVDEVDVAELKLGQSAFIEVDALPDLALEGTLSYISLLPREQGGVIVFEAKITFDVTEGSGLRSGMSANADIVIDERSNVLLVPARAVKRDGNGNTVVNVSLGEQSETRTVVTGISDGFHTEILEGLKKGETILER
ncbi:MAG: efflux RND transporter periplasmic adaptor subunit [Dehalococcoidales bacterium]|nr:efflux RND transporter periplasmic adaptor subunit [Dehalococcoidales bacterium]